ncbi:MAG TPA: DUF4147 domain-containing protein [Chitinophagaceae bacterium]|nr:DUF4147 domain-containing protein [Chitinophagaceae bacterium]
MLQDPRYADAIAIFNAAVEAVTPAKLVPQHLTLYENILTVAGQKFNLQELDGLRLLCIGKAAAGMAKETESILGENIAGGLVITKHHHTVSSPYCATIEAGHPVPDENSVHAAHEVTAFVKAIKPGGLLLCCISGGASALLGDIAAGISLEDLQTLSTLLLQCGASIHEINTVRKHISTLKGGRLVQHTNGATLITLIISDVQGDDLSVIASGLTVEDGSTFVDAFRILKKYDLHDDCPLPVTRHIIEGMRGELQDTPKPGDAMFNNVHNSVIGNNALALQAAAKQAASLGYKVLVTDDDMHGDAGEKAKQFVSYLLENGPVSPTCLLMGGETTVKVKGAGKGGRNQHFVLACINELIRQNVPGDKWPVILSGGTDGTDGPTDAAGAFIFNGMFEEIKKMSLQPAECLANNDAYHFFKRLNALLVTGPTHTNVMDIVVAIIG